MYYDLPKTVELGGAEYPVRSDFRTALDLVQVMSDPEIEDWERADLVMEFFYEQDVPRRLWQEAIDKAYWFVGGGGSVGKRGPKLMDWEQDFDIICPPVSRVLGYDCRDVPYLHWWSFLAAYREIGDCLFAQVVSVRKKRAQGKKLDRSGQAFASENADIVVLRTKSTAAEDAVFDQWIGARNGG